MSYEIDIKYWLQIKHKIKNLKLGKLPTLFNFQCPICGGSQSNPRERTAGIFKGRNKEVYFNCFRQKCKEGSGFGNLLKHVDEEVFKRYYEEKYTWRNNQGEMLLHHDKKMMSIEGKYPLNKKSNLP